MDQVTFVVDTPDNLQQWGTIGHMLATHLPASSCVRVLHIRIQPVREDVARSLSEWFQPLAHCLHAMLPAPRYPSDSVDTLYNVPLVSLNDMASRWKVTLDLSLQPTLESCEPALQCLASALIQVIGERSHADAAKREWILQLYEHGKIHVEPGKHTVEHGVSSESIAFRSGSAAR